MRLLIAEDDRDLRYALELFFQRNNFTVDSVDNGEDALSYLQLGNYDDIKDSDVFYWSLNGSESKSMTCPDTDFGELLRCFGYNCSFKVESGTVSEITLRMSTVEKRPTFDASALNTEVLRNVKLNFSITVKQSKEAGGVTPGGTSMILPAKIDFLSVDLGGQAKLSEDSADGFVMLDGKELSIYTNAEIGSVAKIGIKQSDGMKALVITKKSEQTIVFTYQG